MKRPLMLDLFSGAGGCAVGYSRAGFDVVGVDCKPQPRYPFTFVKEEALWILDVLIHGGSLCQNDHDRYWIRDFAAIHASPPCQVHSAAARIGNARPGHMDLISQTRKLLEDSGRPWVIENVPGAPLHFPVTLCGTQFGLPLRRHRLFESSAFLFSPAESCRHRDEDVTVFGHAVQLCGSHVTPYLDASGRTHYRQKRVKLETGQAAMGIDWMTRAELSQAIPPAYTEFIGRQLLGVV